MSTITQLLVEVRGGNGQALEELIRIAYPELRRLARHYLGFERCEHSLQPTALVHELYLRLVGQTSINYRDHKHFFAACAQIMRHLLVDHARARAGPKRNRASAIDPNEALPCPSCQKSELLALHEALERLAQFDWRQSRIVELRYFGGLTNEEIASVLDISDRTVKREWRMAKAWLYNEVQGKEWNPKSGRD